METPQQQEEKLLRELARRPTVLRLLKENKGATIHIYKTPTGRECYRMVTAVDAPVPKDPLINISKRTVNLMLKSGRLLKNLSENSIILNPNFKKKKNGNSKNENPEGESCEADNDIKVEEAPEARPETGRLF